MGSNRVTLQSLNEKLNVLLSTQVTKEHFDDKLQNLEEKVKGQEERLIEVDKKVEKIENEMPDNIYTELHDQELRKKCAIIFGLPEQNCNNEKERRIKDKETTMELIDALNDIDLISEGDIHFGVLRLGKYKADSIKPRPVKVSFSTCTIRDIVLSCCKNLKGKSEWNGVSIVPDLTKIQQKLSVAKRARLLKEADEKNNGRNSDEVNKFQYKVLGHYGLGNLRILKQTLGN